jgi:S-layer protein (TIGR01567 family)
MKKISLQIFTGILTGILILGLFCGTAAAVADIVSVSPSNSTIVDMTVGETQTFSIQTSESTTIDWLVNGTIPDSSLVTYDNGTNTSSLSHTILLPGTHEVKATVQSTGGSSTWTVNGASEAPVITLSSPSDSSVSSDAGDSQTFTATVSQTANMTWSLDNVKLYTNSSVDSSSYTNSSATAGTHTVKVEAENANGTAESKFWTWTVGSSSTGEVHVEFNPASNNTVEISQGKSQTFYVNSTDSNINVEWIVGSETKQTDNKTDLKSSSFEFKKDTGEYTLKAVVTDPSGNYKPVTKTWNIKVQSKYYSKGNRIWAANLGLSDTSYTWDAQSFSGFYYDLDSGVSSEQMVIKNIKRNIAEGDIEYITSPTETKFEYGSWGSYQIIGFMAEKYFAGYNDNTTVRDVKKVSLISDGILSKILIDNDDKKSAYAGDSFELEDGYSLNVVEVDVNGNSVWIQLEKDGDVVDDDFISSGQDYVYKTKIGDSEDVPIIIVHFGTVFSGTETSAVFIQGIFQVSDTYLELSNGDTYGEMEVKSLSDSEIKMENGDNIGLDEGETIDLMGKIKIQVADDSILRFAPVLDTSEEGTYELRGTVYDEKVDTSLPTWTPYNFEGFYYNIDEGIGTESLNITKLNGNDIPEGELVYTSKPQPVEFEHDAWGNFTVVGFMAKKYFAGYPNNAVGGKVNDVSLLSDNVLSEVLTDSDDKESMYAGDSFELEDGYSLNVLEVDINGKSVWVQLQKDGDVVDEDFVTSNDNYVYKGTLGEAEDIPIIIVHFGTVFAGTETSAVFIQGIFQISGDYIEINNGDTFDEMKITSVSSDSGITMKNDDDIGLGQDETIDVMGDVKFKTADSGTLRFYPFVEVESSGESSKQLKISLPDEIIVGDTFDVEVTAGNKSIEGATVKVNATNVGKTNSDGVVEYTAEEVGTFKMTAEKDGYTTASMNMKVIPPKEKMSLNITPETVYVGDTITIEALKAVGGNPIEGANISINGNNIGETGPDGKITYAANEIGKIKISATADGFLGKNVDVNVKDYEAIFKFSNLVIDPIEVSAGKETTITVDAENTGNAAGEYNVELIVNESSVDSQKISLGVGENTTVTFKHSEETPGTYTVKVADQEATYTVKEKSSMLLYILIGIILLLGGGIAYMFTKGGWTMATLQAKIDELIRSANLKK